MLRVIPVGVWVVFCFGLFAILAPAQPPAPAQAEAPTDIIAMTVADMPAGTQSSVNPETVVIDENRKVWLNKHHPIGGDFPVVVHFLKDGSYEVEIKDGTLRWLKVPLTDDIKKSLVPVKTLHLPKKDKK